MTLVIVSFEVIVGKGILSKICPNLNCKTSDCQARHPKPCKYEKNCKFFGQVICAYSHDTLVNYGKQLKSLESENKILKEENTIPTQL